MFNIEPFTITTVYGGHKISLITKKLRRNLNTTSVNTSRTKILLFVGKTALSYHYQGFLIRSRREGN